MDNIAVIKERWKNNLVGDENSNDNSSLFYAKLSEIEENTKKLCAQINTDGGNLWEDLKWDASADMTTAYRRIFKIALGYGMQASKFYKDEDVKNIILYALEWMFNNRYGEKEIRCEGWRDPKAFNWWDWRIGSPMLLIDTLFVMDGEIPDEKKKQYILAAEEFVPEPRDYGANKIHFTKLGIGIALIKNDSAKIKKLLAQIEDLYDFCDDGLNDGQGFYSDGSYIFHTKHPMNGTYGYDFFDSAIEFYSYFKDTEYAYDEKIEKRLIYFYTNGFVPFIGYGNFMRMSMGRAPQRIEGVGAKALLIGLKVLDLTCDKDKIEGFIKDNVKFIRQETLISQIKISDVCRLNNILMSDAEYAEEFANMYYFCDKAIVKRERYKFALSMSSSRIYNYECINNENTTGWYISDGMTGIYTKERRYGSDYWEKVNPYMIPGTTVDTQERAAVSIGQSNEYLSGEDFVGGAVLNGKYLTAAMCLESYHSDGKFSENNLFKNSAPEYGMAPPAHKCSLKAKKAWFCFDNEIVCLGTGINANDGYPVITVLENQPVKAMQKDKKSFCISNIKYEILDDNEITYNDGDFFEAYIEHGVSPENASYAYAILPFPDIKKEFKVLSNTDKIQAVRCGGITGIVFYEAGEFEDITVDKPCIVMFDSVSLSVSDPTHKLNEVTVMYHNRKYTIVPEYGESIQVEW